MTIFYLYGYFFILLLGNIQYTTSGMYTNSPQSSATNEKSCLAVLVEDAQKSVKNHLGCRDIAVDNEAIPCAPPLLDGDAARAPPRRTPSTKKRKHKQEKGLSLLAYVARL